MSDPKARDSQESKPIGGLNDTERYFNFGVPVELKIGSFTVRELDVVSLAQLSAGGLDLMVAIHEAGESLEGMPELLLMKKMIEQSDSRKLIGRIFSEYCGGEAPEKFERLSPEDFNKLWEAVSKVTDFEQIKKVFFNLGLHKLFPGLMISTDAEKMTAQG
jgi:hypothetical protein